MKVGEDMGKDKIRRFNENLTFECMVQPAFEEVFGIDHPMKGKWSEFFGNTNPIVLELGCGKGRFTAGTAAADPDVLFIAVEIVPDAMVVAMERCVNAGLTNVYFIDAILSAIPFGYVVYQVAGEFLTFAPTVIFALTLFCLLAHVLLCLCENNLSRKEQMRAKGEPREI